MVSRDSPAGAGQKSALSSWTEAQAAVIGAALIDAACVPEILSDMRPEDFSGECRRFYEAFAALSAEGRPIDVVTVVNAIGPAYRDAAMTMMQLTPTSANLSAWIAVCKEQSRLRLLRDCGEQLRGAATLADARESVAAAAEISLETGRRTGYTAAECVTEWFDAINRDEKPEYIDTGIECLNTSLMITPGNFIVVAGYTASGKTALALQMALAVSQTRKVGFFTFEMSRQELTERLISHVSRVDYRRVQRRELSQEEVQYCTQAAAKIYKADLSFEECSGFTVEDIRARTLRQGYTAVFVDYLQHVEAADRRVDAFRRVSEVSMGLKRLAQQHGIPVFAMSQLSRAEKSTEEFVAFPQLRDLRESGQIEQDANAVLFVHAPFPRTMREFRTLHIAKNRKNETDSFHFTFLGAAQTFRPPSDREAGRYARAIEEQRQKASRSRGKSAPPPFTPLTDVKPGEVPFEQGALPL